MLEILPFYIITSYILLPSHVQKRFVDLLVKFFFLLFVSKAVKAPIYLASNKAFYFCLSRDQGAVKEGLEAEWELVISLPSFLTFTAFFLFFLHSREGTGGRVGAGNLFTFLPNIYLLSFCSFCTPKGDQ
jgi:hypothetical protein